MKQKLILLGFLCQLFVFYFCTNVMANEIRRQVLGIFTSIGQNTIEYVGAPCIYNFSQSSKERRRCCVLNTQSQEREDGGSTLEFEDDINYLRSLDPKNWKSQDHYAVLGLRTVRNKATEQDIKNAYRQKVLRHHPDKRKGQGDEVRDEDDYFTCITKAWEILGDKVKRRSYDSVDPEIDDSIPPNNEHTRVNFYKVLREAFERNAYWSEVQPVPNLGDKKSTRAEVNHFYSFWYNFQSWREFSYLDEEEKEKGLEREVRRWIDKQNKTMRLKRKKEEMARIRSLVDLAYNMDERVMKFKKEDKEKKTAARNARKNEILQRKKEEEQAAALAEEQKRIEKQMAEEEERAKREALKAERDALKRALKKEKKRIRDICKENNYFTKEQNEIVAHMTGLERICELFGTEELKVLHKRLQISGREAFLQILQETEKKIEAERQQVLEQQQKNSSPNTSQKDLSPPWPTEQIQLLTKAVNLFPAGTYQRWEQVANFVNQHASGIQRSPKEVLLKAKDLQNSYFRNSKGNASKVTLNGPSTKGEENTETPDRPWTNLEQQQLEIGLKTNPVTTQDRWDKIAACVPTRSKRECMKRYKELAELIRARRGCNDQ